MVFGLTALRIINAKKTVKETESLAVVLLQEKNSQIADCNKTKWSKIKKGIALNTGDFLTVDPMALTEIKFNDGTKITVLENSRLQLFAEQNADCVELLQQAKLIVDTTLASKPVIIKSRSDSIVKIEVNSLAEISVVNSVIDCSIIKGKGIVISSDGVEKIVAQQSGFILADENVMQRKPLVVLTPCIYSSVESNDNKADINFEWSKNNTSIEFVRILLSQDANFKTGVKEFLQDADQLKFSTQASHGIWYWRVIPVASNGEQMGQENFAPQGKFHIK